MKLTGFLLLGVLLLALGAAATLLPAQLVTWALPYFGIHGVGMYGPVLMAWAAASVSGGVAVTARGKS